MPQPEFLTASRDQEEGVEEVRKQGWPSGMRSEPMDKKIQTIWRTTGHFFRVSLSKGCVKFSGRKEGRCTDQIQVYECIKA